MYKLRILPLIILVLSLVVASCSPATTPEPISALPESSPVESTIEQESGPCYVNVALIGPLTGDSAFWGNQMVQGVTLAMEQISSKGSISEGPYKGCTYKLLGPYDDRGDPTESTNIAQMITTMDEVLAIVGPVNSSNAFAILPILDEAKIPTISGGASNSQLTKQGWNNFFRAFLNDAGGATFVAKFVNQLGHKRIVAAYSNNDYGRGIYERFADKAEELGIEIISADAWQPGQDREFSPLVTRWQTQNPDAIFIAGEYTETGLIIKQARIAGLQQPIIAQGSYGPDLLAIAGEHGDGVIVETMFDPMKSDEITSTFVKEFNERFGENPAENGSIGYDAFLVLNDAIHRMKDKGREALIQSLSETKDFPAMNQLVSFDDTGELIVPDSAPLVIIKDGQYESYIP
jgi:branched-chain amino acid transport system substrate-binding protein